METADWEGGSRNVRQAPSSNRVPSGFILSPDIGMTHTPSEHGMNGNLISAAGWADEPASLPRVFLARGPRITYQALDNGEVITKVSSRRLGTFIPKNTVG